MKTMFDMEFAAAVEQAFVSRVAEEYPLLDAADLEEEVIAQMEMFVDDLVQQWWSNRNV